MKRVKKMRIGLYIMFLLLIIISMNFAGCGKSYEINVSTIAIKTGYSVNNIDNTQQVKKGESYEIYVSANEGYSLDNIVVKVNDDIVQGNVTNNNNGVDQSANDDNDGDSIRIWKYIVENISSNIDIIIDFTNCDLLQRSISLTGLSDENILYAVSKENNITYNIEFNNTNVTTTSIVSNDQITVNYGDGVYLFLDDNIELSVLNPISGENTVTSLKKFGEYTYKYNGNYVYYLDNVNANITISKKAYEEHTDGTVDLLIEMLANICFTQELNSLINFEIYGDSLLNSRLMTLNGYSYFDYSFIYFGNEDTFLDEGIDFGLDEGYLTTLGNKAFYRLNLNQQYFDISTTNVEDVASFYLVDNIYTDTSNLTPLTIKRDLTSAYLEINISDIENFIENNRAGLFIKTVINEDILQQDYVGFELNYENQDSYTGVTIRNDENTYALNYCDFVSNKKIVYYYNKSVLFDSEGNYLNNLSISVGGNYYDLESKPYLISTNINMTSVNNTSFNYSDSKNYTGSDDYYDDIYITDLSLSLLKNIFIINIETIFQSFDTSNHAIDFSAIFQNSNLNQTIYITDNLSVPNWIEVKSENLEQLNELTINVDSPLYYYIEGEWGTALPFELNYILKGYSNTSCVNNITNEQMYIQNYTIYALYLIDSYLSEDVQLTTQLID